MVFIKSAANITSTLLANFAPPGIGLLLGTTQGLAYLYIDEWFANEKNNYNETTIINNILVTTNGHISAGGEKLYTQKSQALLQSAISQRSAKVTEAWARKLPHIDLSVAGQRAIKAASTARYIKYLGRGVQAYAIGLDINDSIKEYKEYHKNYGNDSP